MSKNTLSALEQANEQHQPLAMLAIRSIADSAMSFQSEREADAHYATQDGNLTVHARLNEQSRYDIISISSPSANTIHLSAPPPANTHAQTLFAPSHLATSARVLEQVGELQAISITAAGILHVAQDNCRAMDLPTR